MKKVLFLVSHLESGSSAFFDVLNFNYRIQGHKAPWIYENPEAYLKLISLPHKLDNSAAIWMDEILHNTQFTWKGFYDCCKFIYVLREPKSSLSRIVQFKNYKPLQAVRYYTYRLRRMYEMGKRTPGGIILTWEDMITGRLNGEIEDYLNLKTTIQSHPELYEQYQKYSPDLISVNLLKEAEQSFERNLYLLKNQDLRYWK